MPCRVIESGIHRAWSIDQFCVESDGVQFFCILFDRGDSASFFLLGMHGFFPGSRFTM